MAEVARIRGLLRDGPDEDGRYLVGESLEVKDLIEAVARSRRESRTHARAGP